MADLVVEGLRVRYGTGPTALTAVDGIDLAVSSGSSLGVVGESGSGKSSIARAVVGLVRVAEGRVLLDGSDITNPKGKKLKQLRNAVQMVFQDPYASLNPRMAIGEVLDEAIKAHRTMRRSDRRDEAARLLDLVGLDASALDRYPHQFSGGGRQRIAIARALSANPEILILDEVTSSLDVSVQAQILNLLRNLRISLGMAYLLISHDLSVIRYMCDFVSVMYLGRIVESAPAVRLFQSPRHPYTRTMLDSIPELRKAKDVEFVPQGDVPDPRRPPSGCRFHTRCPIGPMVQGNRAVCAELDPHTTAMWREHGVACHFPLDQALEDVELRGPGISEPR
jgi:peptide/nickel transport system ATP-binding protein